MITPPILTGQPPTDRALITLAKLLAEIARSSPAKGGQSAPDSGRNDDRDAP
jgi:hypothetical protein